MSSTSAAASVNSSEIKLPLYVDNRDCYIAELDGKLRKIVEIIKEEGNSVHGDNFQKSLDLAQYALRRSRSMKQLIFFVDKAMEDFRRSQKQKEKEGKTWIFDETLYIDIHNWASNIAITTAKYWKTQEAYAERKPKRATIQAAKKAANNTRKATSKAIRNSMSASFAERKEEDKKRHTQNKFNAAVASGNHIKLSSFARSLHLLKENQIGKYLKIAEKQHVEKQAARKTKKNSPKKLSSVKENNEE
jgi:hypothetical protein